MNAKALFEKMPATADALDTDPASQRTIYASRGTGGCMEPLIAADATLAFDPTATVEPGDVAIFWFTPEAARRIGAPGWVKKLVRPLPPPGSVGIIHLEMLNPPRSLTLSSTDVRAIHKCVGPAQSAGVGKAVFKPGSWPNGADASLPVATVKIREAASQPTLALFEEVPVGMATVHAAQDNRMAPLVRRGEIAIIEGDGRAGWLPTEGGIFLIERVSKPSDGSKYERRTRSIVQTRTDGHGRWWATAVAAQRGIGADGVLNCDDGPYDQCQMADRLVGKVVGLLACSLKSARA